jgi:hypothetical protein
MALSSLPPESETDAALPQQEFPQRPHLRQLALQLAAAFSVLSIAWPYFGLRNEALPWPTTALVIGCTAFLFATFTRQPCWWIVIHALFAPLAWWISTLGIDPGWFLLALILLLLVYRGAISGQVPLYLSNRDTAEAIAELTAERQGMRFVDLGAGIGSVLIPLAKTRLDAHMAGIENAPATWLVGYLRTIGLTNCNWRWGDIWQANLAEYDVVYAFLSPVPMPALWEKVQREMRPGSLFISNSFAVPEIQASQVVEVGDARQTLLYCYQL